MNTPNRNAAFHSILFEQAGEGDDIDKVKAPDFFRDLNIDRIIDEITASFKDYDLKPLFNIPLTNEDAISYRHEVMENLDDEQLMKAINAFAERMRAMRAYLSDANDENRSNHKFAMQRLFFEAVEIYCEAVQCLHQDLSALDLQSRGLRSLRDYLAPSPSLRNLVSQVTRLKSDLSSIRYGLLINNDTITVRPYGEEVDYNTVIEETFGKFKSIEANQSQSEPRKTGGVNHIEAQVQEHVAQLFPEISGALENFCSTNANYLDKKIGRFDREIQFYIAYRAYVEKLRSAGLKLCLPQLSKSKDIKANNVFDMALAGKSISQGAGKSISQGATVVTNDFYLRGQERIIVVSGPNQGGKTTFARTYGQLHYLAALGCPVAGSDVRLFLFDKLYTHFDRKEDIKNLRSRLQDDLVRIREILDEATPNSIIILNEIFSSTTLSDAVFLNKKVMEKMSSLDLLGVCVTFLDELASFNQKTVSLVSAVDPNDLATRTFKLERRPADGLAYALAIAQKHRVTYKILRERIKA